MIEEAAQACGGPYQGRRLGTFRDVGCSSFQYHKTITVGEGDACVTNDAVLCDRLMGCHDTAPCSRPERFGEECHMGELFCGVHYRMGELTRAYMGTFGPGYAPAMADHAESLQRKRQYLG